MHVEEEIARLQQQTETLFCNDERHEKAMKEMTNEIKCIRKELIREISNRLPNWAVFLLSALTACVGWLVSMVVI